jgi:predicted tellurium resistance membrane protein TerC
MSPDILQFSPFTNFLIPGIILLTANGVLSLVVVFFTIRQLSEYYKLIILQGCILLGWISIQMVMLQTVNSLQIIYGIAGMLMIAAGLRLSRANVVT